MTITNPYRPGTGQVPPYLAGRDDEKNIFEKLLEQDIILENLLITGLRGIGKTVLLETLKPIAIKNGWLWTGDDFSQSMSVDEDRLATRLLVDISYLTAGIQIGEKLEIGFSGYHQAKKLDYTTLRSVYDSIPGLPSDKLKRIFEIIWQIIPDISKRGIIFAYDEAQTLADDSENGQHPLSLLLDVFSAVQRKGMRFMLVLTGLPTLQPNLVATRTYSERLFNVLVLKQLSTTESRDAVLVPLHTKSGKPKPDMVMFDDEATNIIVDASGGYPYFIQFICRETYDIFEQQVSSGQSTKVPLDAIMEKLDNNFFYGRWAKASEREKDLMIIIAQSGLEEFTPTQIMKASITSTYKRFGLAQTSSYLKQLIDDGLIYKDRRGMYSFAVPLLSGYILRNITKVI